MFEKRKEAVKEIFSRLQKERTEKMDIPKRQIHIVCQKKAYGVQTIIDIRSERHQYREAVLQSVGT